MSTRGWGLFAAMSLIWGTASRRASSAGRGSRSRRSCCCRSPGRRERCGACHSAGSRRLLEPGAEREARRERPERDEQAGAELAEMLDELHALSVAEATGEEGHRPTCWRARAPADGSGEVTGAADDAGDLLGRGLSTGATTTARRSRGN